MTDYVVDFSLEDTELSAEFELDEPEEFDAILQLDVAPEKVSQLENDLDFQSGEQVAASIQAASDIINARIDSEVEALNTEIDKKVETITGSPLIDVQRTGNAVTLTSKTYIHEQGVASDTWVIEHNLNKYPSVTLIDTAGTIFIGRVEYIDTNNCIVTINGSTKGKALLN